GHPGLREHGFDDRLDTFPLGRRRPGGVGAAGKEPAGELAAALDRQRRDHPSACRIRIAVTAGFPGFALSVWPVRDERLFTFDCRTTTLVASLGRHAEFRCARRWGPRHSEVCRELQSA